MVLRASCSAVNWAKVAVIGSLVYGLIIQVIRAGPAPLVTVLQLAYAPSHQQKNLYHTHPKRQGWHGQALLLQSFYSTIRVGLWELWAVNFFGRWLSIRLKHFLISLSEKNIIHQDANNSEKNVRYFHSSSDRADPKHLNKWHCRSMSATPWCSAVLRQDGTSCDHIRSIINLICWVSRGTCVTTEGQG